MTVIGWALPALALIALSPPLDSKLDWPPAVAADQTAFVVVEVKGNGLAHVQRGESKFDIKPFKAPLKPGKDQRRPYLGVMDGDRFWLDANCMAQIIFIEKGGGFGKPQVVDPDWHSPTKRFKLYTSLTPRQYAAVRAMLCVSGPAKPAADLRTPCLVLPVPGETVLSDSVCLHFWLAGGRTATAVKLKYLLTEGELSLDGWDSPVLCLMRHSVDVAKYQQIIDDHYRQSVVPDRASIPIRVAVYDNQGDEYPVNVRLLKKSGASELLKARAELARVLKLPISAERDIALAGQVADLWSAKAYSEVLLALSTQLTSSGAKEDFEIEAMLFEFCSELGIDPMMLLKPERQTRPVWLAIHSITCCFGLTGRRISSSCLKRW